VDFKFLFSAGGARKTRKAVMNIKAIARKAGKLSIVIGQPGSSRKTG
jgi:hypothetical protein